MKKPIAVAIAALYPRHNHIEDFHVLAHLHRRPVLTCEGRRYGKVYAAYQRELIRHALQLSAGATLRLLSVSRMQRMDRIVSYDLAGGEDKSVECTFKRNYATGGLTLVSVNVLSRKWRGSPWFYFDEWPWA